MASLVLPWKSGRSVGPVVLFTAAGCSPAWNFPFFFRGGHPESLVFHYYIYIYRSIIIVIYNYIYIYTYRKQKRHPEKTQKTKKQQNDTTQLSATPPLRCAIFFFVCVCVFFWFSNIFLGKKQHKQTKNQNNHIRLVQELFRMAFNKSYIKNF